MKKFLAGALAAALALSFPATAVAAETKTVTRPDEVVYDVPIAGFDIVLNIALPAKIKAALNPYGTDFELSDQTTITTQNGIVSVAYPVFNYDTNYGVFFDVTAVTTTSSKKWSVIPNTLTPGEKAANMSFVASDTEAGIAVYSNVNKPATSVNDQGCLVLDSTVPADKAKKILKGTTSQKKVAYVPASEDGETPSKIYLGFSGILADDSPTTIVNWTSDDTISVSLILKIIPASKTLGAIPDP